VREFRAWLERQLYGAPLEDVLGLRDEVQLQAWATRGTAGDLRRFITIAADCGLAVLGRGPGRCLSYGAFPDALGTPAFAPGLWQAGGVTPPDLDGITEDATHAWLADAGGPRHPRDGLTRPDADKPEAYTWNKAPRLAGQVVETGAVARQLCAGQPLVADLAQRHGGTVYTRVIARLVELARLVPLMEAWLQALAPREPFAAPTEPATRRRRRGPERSRARRAGPLAAHGRRPHRAVPDRGAHQLELLAARRRGTPGPLEQALVDAPVQPGEATPVAVQHIVRSFDPCMVCTVH
jgi:Ni,Fe-hydrogenase I large subunit